MDELSREELWCPVFFIRPGRTPPRSRINHLLKHAGAWGIEFVDEMKPAEVDKLRRDHAALRAEAAQLAVDKVYLEGKWQQLSRTSVDLVSQLKRENAELRAEVARLTELLD